MPSQYPLDLELEARKSESIEYFNRAEIADDREVKPATIAN
jgi:hypothetical protein